MLLLLACAPPPAEEPFGARWHPERLQSHAEELFAMDVVSVPEAREIWPGLLSLGDADCPGDPLQLPGGDLRGCTADSGVFYAGMATFTEDDLGGFILSGDFEIVDTLGHRFFGGGALSGGPSLDGWSSSVRGDWGWVGGGGWLDPEVSAWLVAGRQGQAITVDGGLTEGGRSAWFEELRWDPGACEGLSGALELRDPGGGWWRLDYGECSACAALSYEGEALGEACPDAAGWLGRLDAAAP